MQTIIKKISKIPNLANVVYLMKDMSSLSVFKIPQADANTVRTQKLVADKNLITILKADNSIFFYFPKDKETTETLKLEEFRKAGDKLQGILNSNKLDSVVICNNSYSAKEVIAFTEGLALGNYRFDKYKTKDKKDNEINLKKAEIFSENITDAMIDELNIIVDAEPLLMSLYHILMQKSCRRKLLIWEKNQVSGQRYLQRKR
jgi:leucyl aminopeptidase